MDDTVNQLEALLFASGKFMTEENLSLLTGIEQGSIRPLLLQLKQSYDEREGSLMLVQENDAWKINVRERYLDLVRKIVADTELPKSVLETLAVIAWQSPALQSKVVTMRGNKAYEHIAQLEEMGFVTKAKEGRSFKLKVTEKFFEYFDVEGTKDLKEMFKEVHIPKKQDAKEDVLEETAELGTPVEGPPLTETETEVLETTKAEAEEELQEEEKGQPAEEKKGAQPEPPEKQEEAKDEESS